MTPSTELLTLCGAVRDETATPADVARLEALLADDPDARRFYLRFMQLGALLERYEQVADPSTEAMPPSPSRRFRPRLLLALAACVAFGAVAYFPANRRTNGALSSD